MNLEQIKRTLEEKLSEHPPLGSRRQIIFWYDAKGDFAEEVERLKLTNGKIWRLERDKNFLTKYTIEVLDPESNYVIYSQSAKPADRENWLLDTLLYSYEFTADRISMIMNDLRAPQSLRGTFMRYERFFGNKERCRRFTGLKIANYTEPVIDSAILAVLAKQQAASISDSLRAIFSESLDEKDNPLWQDIIKFGDAEAFWTLMEREYGFVEHQKTLKALFLGLVITAFSQQFTGDLPKAWEKYVLAKPANCLVFIDHFMNHMGHSKYFQKLAREAEGALHLSSYLKEWGLPHIAEVDIFPSLDKAVIDSLVGSLENRADNYEYYLGIIEQRRTKHFYPQYEETYNALYWAIRLLEYQREFGSGFFEQKAEGLFQAYVQRYYEADYAYRKYCLAYDKAKRPEILHGLNERIENLYCNWYLQDLSIKWSELVEQELSCDWFAVTTKKQQSFYINCVAPIAQKSERVFVIVSDALRYEAGYELMEALNQNVTGLSSIESMLGVVPSYTQLGMAALLPHDRLQMVDGEVLADGLSTSGLANRQQILQQNAEAVALRLPDLLHMDRQAVRETVKGKHVVYIYHDTIDAVGDQAKTEDKAFEAVEQAIQEIIEAVQILVKNLSEVTAYITSDHGFIYHRSPLHESDKTVPGDEQPILFRRRFMLFDKPVEVPNTMAIDLGYLFGPENTRIAVVPKAHNRYKVQGPGQRFVHGGAGLQEIVIPLVRFRNDRRRDLSKEATKVDVRMLTESRRITNSIFSLTFFQTEPVGGKITPRKLKAYFRDPDGSVISDEVLLVADRSAPRAEDRIYEVRFTLKSRRYDRSAVYHLVLEDTEEVVETVYEQTPFTLDLGIMPDFGF